MNAPVLLTRGSTSELLVNYLEAALFEPGLEDTAPVPPLAEIMPVAVAESVPAPEIASGPIDSDSVQASVETAPPAAGFTVASTPQVEAVVGQVDPMTASETGLPLEPVSSRREGTLLVVSFMVGPFRFLLPATDVAFTPPVGEIVHTTDALELVPVNYRAQSAQSRETGGQTLWVKGRLALQHCRLEGSREVMTSSLKPRAAGASSPWIGATLREPPAFVLDTPSLLRAFVGG